MKQESRSAYDLLKNPPASAAARGQAAVDVGRRRAFPIRAAAFGPAWFSEQTLLLPRFGRKSIRAVPSAECEMHDLTRETRPVSSRGPEGMMPLPSDRGFP